MMIERFSNIVVLTFGLTLGACATSSDALVCTDELRSTLTVQVRDSVTRRGAALGATVIVVGTAVIDSTADMTGDSVTAYMAWEDRLTNGAPFVPKGTYTVRVRKAGYSVWQQQATVPGDNCHSGPGPLVLAKLRPQ